MAAQPSRRRGGEGWGCHPESTQWALGLHLSPGHWLRVIPIPGGLCKPPGREEVWENTPITWVLLAVVYIKLVCIRYIIFLLMIETYRISFQSTCFIMDSSIILDYWTAKVKLPEFTPSDYKALCKYMVAQACDYNTLGPWGRRIPNSVPPWAI